MTRLRPGLLRALRLFLEGCFGASLLLMWRTEQISLGLDAACICIAVMALFGGSVRGIIARAAVVALVSGVQLLDLWHGGDLDANDAVELPLMSVLAFLFAAFARKRAGAEEAMRRHNTRLTRLVDRLPLATVAFDQDANVITWNRRAEELFGWRADEVIGLENPIVPVGARASSDEIFRKIRAGESMHGVEVERCARDGTLLDLALFSAPLSRTSALVLYADISERKRAERDLADAQHRYRELVESLPLVTYVDRVDDNATNVYTSPQIEQLLGWSPELWLEETRVFWDLLHPDDLERVTRAVHHANESGEPFESEYRLRHRDGHYVWVRDQSSIYASPGHEPFARGFLLDITDEKVLEEQLLQSQKMDALGQFAGGIAHDFNNLLTGIGGYADLAAASTTDTLVSRCLAGITTAATEAASLTSRLLTFSRRHVPERRLVDLNEIVAGAGELLDRVVREDVRVEVQLADGLPPVSGDAAQLKQVVLNLALNGRDAMAEGGLLTLETSLAGDQVHVRVRDTGCGMDDATRMRALEPFFTTKPEGEGTGLGLSVAYAVVEGMGGTLSLTSELGEGTTAEIALPAAAGEAERRLVAPAASAQVGGGDRILLVEDREVVRALARDVLRAAGFDVAVAAGSDEAHSLVEAAREPFDLLLTDVVMPDVSGPELAAALRATNPELPVVYMSGYTDDVLDAAELARPRTSFVPKPFANADLVAAVRATLDAERHAAAATG